MTRIFRWTFVAAFVLITVLVVIPNPEDVAPGTDMTRWFSRLLFGDVEHADKVAHFIAFGGLGGLGALSRFERPFIFAWGPAALAAWGGLLEIVQGFIAERQTDVFDAMTNALGAACGWMGGLVLVAVFARTLVKDANA